MKTWFEAGADWLLQGTSAGQLCPMEEKVLLPLQDERWCRDRRAGPMRVPGVCQEGTEGIPAHRILIPMFPCWTNGHLSANTGI